MSKTANQHTVPEFFLKRFSENGQNLYQLKSPAVEEEWRFRNVNKLSVSRHIYTIYSNDGEREFTVENAFSKLESKVADILVFLDSNAIVNLTTKQRYLLAEFMAVQLYRTPRIKEMLMGQAAEFDDVDFQLKILNSCKSEIVEKFGEEEYTASLDKLENSELVTELTKDWFVRTVFFDRSPRIRNLILSMNWRKVKVKKGLDKNFVCSDHPFAVRRRGVLIERRLGRIVGLERDLDAEFYFPISKKLMLIGSHDRMGDETASRFRVDELNKIIFANRHRFVWSPTPCAATKQHFESMGDFRIPTPNVDGKAS